MPNNKYQINNNLVETNRKRHQELNTQHQTEMNDPTLSPDISTSIAIAIQENDHNPSSRTSSDPIDNLEMGVVSKRATMAAGNMKRATSNSSNGSESKVTAATHTDDESYDQDRRSYDTRHNIQAKTTCCSRLADRLAVCTLYIFFLHIVGIFLTCLALIYVIMLFLIKIPFLN